MPEFDRVGVVLGSDHDGVQEQRPQACDLGEGSEGFVRGAAGLCEGVPSDWAVMESQGSACLRVQGRRLGTRLSTGSSTEARYSRAALPSLQHH